MLATQEYRTQYRDPEAFVWGDELRETLEDRAWHCPTRLILGEDGRGTNAVWRRLYVAQMRKRSSGSISSLLPVAALHTFPGRVQDDLAKLASGAREPIPRNGQPAPDHWTPWVTVSYRKLAGLAGLTKNTVGTAFRELEGLGFAQTITAPRLPDEPKARKCFRLARELFPQPGEEFFAFPGAIVGGGVWSLMPLKAARHLYVAVGALDAIRNEERLSERLETDDYNRREGDELTARLDKLREKGRVSNAEMERITGLSYATLVDARQVLLDPVAEGVGALVRRETRDRYASTWYAIRPNAARIYWHPDHLNNPTSIGAWPAWRQRQKERTSKRRRGRPPPTRAGQSRRAA